MSKVFSLGTYTRRLLIPLVISIVFTLGSTCSFAQYVDTNYTNYGIWQWLSDPLSKYDYPEIRGRMYAARWADIETSPGVWDWTLFDQQILSRVNDSLPVMFKVYTKEDAPEWLYSNGVPKVIEKDDAGNVTGWAPYYTDPDYKYYFKRMITNVRMHVETFPPSIRNSIIGVQACFGSTGDYISYKGNVDPQYYLNYFQFFQLFKEFSTYYYNEYLNTSPKIYLISNPPNTGKDQFQWCEQSIPGGWYKCGTMSKGYQLNDEKSKSDWLYPILNKRKAGGKFTRARCEITHDGLLTDWWLRIPYENMFSIMCYGIHWGLDWSNQGPTQINNHQYDSAFNFFNKYAGHKDPVTSPFAMCALKDVIDASDTERFPENTFGPATRTVSRFKSVLQPFIPYGARLEDTVNAILTENENVDANGINDVGWDLFPGNYERYLHQLNANATTTGYWNVTSADSASMFGKFARGFDIANGKDALYFDIDSAYFNSVPLNGSYSVIVEITYLDKGNGSWQLYYDSKSSANTLVLKVDCKNTGYWKKASVTLKDAYFGNRASNGSDFYIKNTPGNTENVLFTLAELRRPKPNNSDIGLFASSPAGFDTVCVNSVTSRMFTVSGAFLSQANVIIGPKSGLKFSLAADSAFSDSLVLVNPGAAFKQTVYAQFSASKEFQLTGSFPIKGGGQKTIYIPVKGMAVSSLPDYSATVSDITCYGSKNGSITLTTTGGISPVAYKWSSSESSRFNSTSKNISGLAASNYTLTITSSGGCTTTSTYLIQEPASLVIAVTFDTIICSGSPTNLYVSGSGGISPYNGTGTYIVFSGSYNYTISDKNGCAKSKFIRVPNGILSRPDKPAIIQSSSADIRGVCAPGDYTYSISKVAGAGFYNWYIPLNSSISSTSNGGATAILTTYEGFAGGTLSVAAGNSCGISSPQSKTISLLPAAPPGGIKGPAGVTARQTGVTYSVGNTTGLTYTWTVPPGCKIISGQGTSKINVTWGSSSGNVRVYASNDCGSSPNSFYFVTVNSIAAAEESSLVQEVHDTLMVYPNPAHETVNVNFYAQNNGVNKIELTDIAGKPLMRSVINAQKGNNTFVCNLRNIASGFYLFHIIEVNGTRKTVKIFKN